MPGTGITAITRQMPRTIRVKMMRDFSSGILKQLANVLAIAASMDQRLSKSGLWARDLRLVRNDKFARTALPFDLRFGRSTEGMSADGELACQFAVAENFYAGSSAIGETGFAQRVKVNTGAVIETIERFQMHWNITGRVPRVIKPALGNAAD